MVRTETPVCHFGEPALDFSLMGVDGNIWSLEDCRGDNGLLIMFICNHCPYVKAINQKLVRDANDLKLLGIESVAIMPNDTKYYPEDSLENMKLLATKMKYPFPYLFDDTQSVARDYGAVCTPDFFGYNSKLQLQYRGLLDESGSNPDKDDVQRNLYLAMKQVAESGVGPKEQIPSLGCSIKWRDS
jgi:peroxiredoxin